MSVADPRRTRAAFTRIGTVAIGLALLGAGRADASAPAPGRGLPEGTRLTAPQTAASDPYQRGKALLASGDLPGAVAALRAALAADPQSVDALNGLGIAFDRLGRYDIARGYYDMALALAPDHPLVLNNLGYSLYLQGQDAAAIPILRRALAATTAGGPGPAQRILTLIADRMRTRVVASETALARADIAAPAARVELSANGEQRLVLAATLDEAPAPELIARLGDAAPLTTPARPWTAREEAMVVASAAPAPPPPAASAAPAVAVKAMLSVVVATAALPTGPGALPLPLRRRDEPVSGPFRANLLANLVVPARPVERRPAPRDEDRVPAGIVVNALRDDRALAWLTVVVAAAPPHLTTASPPHLTTATTLIGIPAAPAFDTPAAPVFDTPAVPVFDSDDAALNAFAARMAVWRSLSA